MASQMKRSHIMQKICVLNMIWSMTIFLFPSTDAFTLPPQIYPKVDLYGTQQGSLLIHHIITSRRMTSAPLTRVDATSDTQNEVAKLVDKNNNEFTEGCIVRVNSSNLKAYQVPGSGKGHFDDDKNFVKNIDNSKDYLALPEGLRGVVIRVYDINDLGPNYPIKVKFEKGLKGEEGYTPPVTFLMHFDTVEVDVVV